MRRLFIIWLMLLWVLPAAAQESPDCTLQLAFGGSDRRGDNLYLIDADGTNLRRLTDNNDAWQLSWSPDGSQIVYESGDGDSELFILDVETRESQQITDNENTDYFPAWAPVDATIAFTSGRDGELDIFVIDSDGENARNLTPEEDVDGDLPTWSPDGTQIAFYSDDGIMVIDVESGSLRTLLEHENDATYYFPAWSPDGETLIVSRIDYVENSEDLYLVDADGENLRPLVVEPGESFSASWSPDGSQISYTANRGDGYQIYVANADGSGERLLTENYPPITGGLHSEWRPCPAATDEGE